MRRFNLVWSLLLLALYGCSRSEPLPAPIRQTLLTADHAVVTNRILAFGTNIAGENVIRLAKAVATARHPTDVGSLSAFDLEVAFYRGTNCLNLIRLEGGAFLLEDKEYYDNSGVLKAFYLKLEDELGPR